MVSTGRSFLRRTAAALGASALLVAGMAPAASASPSLDGFNESFPNFYDRAREAVNSPGVPEDVASSLNRALDFLTGEGDGEPGFEVPENAPRTTQFLLPSVSAKCIGGESGSFGLATSVPGPAPLPLPGVGEGEIGFIFTGLGTKPLAEKQDTEMNVYWVNVANAKVGKTQLTGNGINAESGPAAVNGTAATGKGLVLAVVDGGITVAEESGPVNCKYSPTVGVIPVGIGR